MAAHRLVRPLAAVALCAAIAGAGATPAHADGKSGKKKAADKDEAGEGVTSMCIDKEIADRLAVKRKRRGAVDRLFVKQARHELSAVGGYYISDLYSGTYVVGGSYTYHMTESTGVEFGVQMTHENADTIVSIEDGRAQVLDNTYARVLSFESALILTPIYGKLRLGGTIVHFDIHVDLGIGVVDSQTSRGAAGIGGMGLKLFLGKAWAFRIDFRDHVFRQELLDERFIVNDLAITSGFSLFLPLRN